MNTQILRRSKFSYKWNEKLNLSRSLNYSSKNTMDPVISPLIGLDISQRNLYIEAKKFAESNFRPHASHWDENSIFPKDVMMECGKQGYGGMLASTDLGGRNYNRKQSLAIIEALATVCVSTTALITIHNACVGIMGKLLSQEKKVQWLPKLISMESMASFCLTEPGSGSDAASLVSVGQLDNATGEYVISGQKCFISGAGMSELYIVMCRTSPTEISAIVVPHGVAGLSFGANEKKMGWRSSPTRQVFFDNVRVPVGNRLGKEGEGFKIAMSGLDGARLSVSACSLGAASACLEIAINRYKESGRDNQSFLFKLAELYEKLTASRCLLREAAIMMDSKSPHATNYCAMAKQSCTDNGSIICGEVMQLLGYEGLLQKNDVERHTRDVRVHQILEGTNEIMRHILGRSIIA